MHLPCVYLHACAIPLHSLSIDRTMTWLVEGGGVGEAGGEAWGSGPALRDAPRDGAARSHEVAWRVKVTPEEPLHIRALASVFADASLGEVGRARLLLARPRTHETPLRDRVP